MKKYILLIGSLFAAGSLHAQIQVNNGTNNGIANSNVLLDGSTYFSTESGAQPNTGKGIVVPSVNLVNFEFDLNLADSVTFPTYFDGMIVYNNATGNTLTSGNRPSLATAVIPGFYYFSNPNGASNGNVTGGQWKPLGQSAIAAMTASNGLTVTSNDIKLGGTLVQPTTVNSSDTNPLNFTSNGSGPAANFMSSDFWVSSAFSSPSTAFGNTPSPDKVVLGTLYGIATIGAHNNALNAWSDLAINPGGGNLGISTYTPLSTLDITAKSPTGTATETDGILIPRVTRERAASMTSVPVSTMVYINDIIDGSQSGTAVNIDVEGFYYFDGNIWQKSVGKNIYDSDGNLTADRLVSQGSNKLTFDTSAINGFSVAGSTFSIDGANSRTGIGISTPEATLDINGTGRVRNVPEAAGSTLIFPVYKDSDGNLVKASSSSTYHAMLSNNANISPRTTGILISGLSDGGIYKVTVTVGDGCGSLTIADFYIILVSAYNNVAIRGISGLFNASSSGGDKFPIFNELAINSTSVSWNNVPGCSDGSSGSGENYTLSIPSSADGINITNDGNIMKNYGVTAIRIN